MTYTPSLMTTAMGALETSPLSAQVMPWPVRPSPVMVGITATMASQISSADMSPVQPAAWRAS